MCKKIKDLLEKKMEDFIEKAEIAIKFFGGIKFLIMWLIIIYVLVGYNYQIMSWYNDNIIPVLDCFEPNTWIFAITFLPIFFVVCNLLKRLLVRYQSDKKEISTLLFISIILIICRCSGDYDYVPFTENVSYVDIICGTCVAYWLVAFFNKWRKRKSNNDNDNQCSHDNDKPIENALHDRYGFTNYVKALVPRIKELDSRKTWSIAINAPWGAGKTSFINLIKEEIEKDFEIIEFNPRNSKSVSHIQEDFFNTLTSALSKYDSKCSHTLKAYMASLQLIDQSGIVKKIVDFYHIWNKKSLKKSIEDSFASLKKRVLVAIDDFDRLTKEEILEVLKLIDSNAAFPNLIFLTAYDKGQVNKILKDFNQSDDACFIDKYFYREYTLPLRELTFSYLEKPLDRDLRLTIDEKTMIKKSIMQHISKFKTYITTIRDGKRFICQFVENYELVKENVSIPDYLLVQLIKFGDDKSYNALRQEKYTERHILDRNLLVLKEFDPNPPIYPIIKDLFPAYYEVDTDYENQICNAEYFDLYFDPFANMHK